ncbi:hypothetical protein WMY93_021462 [Mugilogobius chulae]|uniref:Uncharacterized protein n=1 Tax=Mugilogobius chulae TaxID=88201 RepID=A0AAW0NAQ2_9GOBI
MILNFTNSLPNFSFVYQAVYSVVLLTELISVQYMLTVFLCCSSESSSGFGPASSEPPEPLPQPRTGCVKFCLQYTRVCQTFPRIQAEAPSTTQPLEKKINKHYDYYFLFNQSGNITIMSWTETQLTVYFGFI